MLTRFTKNWSKRARILLYAQSVWFGGWLPLIILAVPEVLFLAGVEVSPLLVWVLAFACAALTPWLRTRPQKRTLPDVE